MSGNTLKSKKGYANSALHPMAFQSAASSLVDETLHPLEQLRLLDEKVLEHRDDIDAVIECRIKQLALQRLLCYLYEFPRAGLIRAEVALVEAYASGDYFSQAEEHLARVCEECALDLYDDAQRDRLQADAFIAEGSLKLARTLHANSNCSREKLVEARKALDKALRLTRMSYSENDVRCARVYTMKGRIERHLVPYARSESEQYDFGEVALECFRRARDIWITLQEKNAEPTSGAELWKTLEIHRTTIQIAESLRSCGHAGHVKEACEEQEAVISALKDLSQHKHGDWTIVRIIIDAATQLAQWLQSLGEDQEGLVCLRDVEKIVSESLGDEQNAFTYSWQDHCLKTLDKELEDRRRNAPREVSPEDWHHNLQIVDQYGTLMETLDQNDLSNLDENCFPVSVKIKDTRERQKLRCQLVDIKRDIALLYVKLKRNDEAIQYLNEVHYFERCLHGSQSSGVARTLKALGTVYLANKSFSEAESCLRQSLRIFENEHPPNIPFIRDIQAKLHSIDAM